MNDFVGVSSELKLVVLEAREAIEHEDFVRAHRLAEQAINQLEVRAFHHEDIYRQLQHLKEFVKTIRCH